MRNSKSEHRPHCTASRDAAHLPELASHLTPADLHRLFSPNYEERRWVPTIARTSSSQVALLVHLKIFQAVGRFLPIEEIPEAAIEQVARESAPKRVLRG